jgi:DNA-binding XRE family transcriptional regulator
MHSIPGREVKDLVGSYHKCQVLTRPDSLPYVFRKLRIHRNLTKRSLAEMFSVSDRYISEIENGSKFPSLSYCLKCGELFGANAQWVKLKWAREATHRYQEKLYGRLGLD